MGLRAKRPGATNTGAVNTEATQAVETQEQQAPPVTQEAPVQSAPPAQRMAQPPATSKPNAIADLNAGILENIDDLTGGGNYVTVDGTTFLYKASNETATEIEIVVAGGKRFYQYVDETDPDNKQFHNSDTKLDNRYKFKFELRWFELLEEDDEPVEHIMSLSTTSAIQFVNYVQGLAKKGLGVGQVVTKMTISRQQRQGSNDRYSRVEFENVGMADNQ